MKYPTLDSCCFLVTSFLLLLPLRCCAAEKSLQVANDGSVHDPLFGSTDPLASLRTTEDEGARKLLGRRMKKEYKWSDEYRSTSSPRPAEVVPVPWYKRGKHAIMDSKKTKGSKKTKSSKDSKRRPKNGAAGMSPIQKAGDDNLLFGQFASATAESPIIETSFSVRSDEPLVLDLTIPPNVDIYLVTEGDSEATRRRVQDLTSLTCPPEGGVLLDFAYAEDGGLVTILIPGGSDSEITICNQEGDVIGVYFHDVVGPASPTAPTAGPPSTAPPTSRQTTSAPTESGANAGDDDDDGAETPMPTFSPQPTSPNLTPGVLETPSPTAESLANLTESPAPTFKATSTTGPSAFGTEAPTLTTAFPSVFFDESTFAPTISGAPTSFGFPTDSNLTSAESEIASTSKSASTPSPTTSPVTMLLPVPAEVSLVEGPPVTLDVDIATSGAAVTAAPIALTPAFYKSMPWAALPAPVQAAATILGYDQLSWEAGQAIAELGNSTQFWSQLTEDEKFAATVLLYDASSWNAEITLTCKMPETWFWADIPEELIWAAKYMGYDAESWDTSDSSKWPSSTFASWDELTQKERLGAKALGYTKKTWEDGC